MSQNLNVKNAICKLRVAYLELQQKTEILFLGLGFFLQATSLHLWFSNMPLDFLQLLPVLL